MLIKNMVIEKSADDWSLKTPGQLKLLHALVNFGILFLARRPDTPGITDRELRVEPLRVQCS